jgi:hypothetical protein
MDGGGESFDWQRLVPSMIHPTKVLVIEALWWIGEPLSATDFTKMFAEEKLNLSRLSYHVTTLADAGVLEEAGRRKVRGSTEKFYFFTAQK